MARKVNILDKVEDKIPSIFIKKDVEKKEQKFLDKGDIL